MTKNKNNPPHQCSEEFLRRDVVYDIVAATDDNIFIVPGFLVQHLMLGNLQSARYLLYYQFVFSA